MSGSECKELVLQNGSSSLVWKIPDLWWVMLRKNKSDVKSDWDWDWGNTTNLFNRLKKHHKLQEDENTKAQRNNVTVTSLNPCPCAAVFYRTSPYPPSFPGQTEIINAVRGRAVCPINTEKRQYSVNLMWKYNKDILSLRSVNYHKK